MDNKLGVELGLVMVGVQCLRKMGKRTVPAKFLYGCRLLVHIKHYLVILSLFRPHHAISSC